MEIREFLNKRKISILVDVFVIAAWVFVLVGKETFTRFDVGSLLALLSVVFVCRHVDDYGYQRMRNLNREYSTLFDKAVAVIRYYNRKEGSNEEATEAN